MFKKLVLLTVILLASLTTAQAGWNSDITMLVVPEEKIPLQIAQDLSRRYPILLVSYRLERGEAKLHAWNGDTWIPVSADEYANGTFFANRPTHAIIVENERVHVPLALTPNSTWCTTASRLTTTDPRILLHLFGRYFNFPFRYWNQFAQRYNYTIEEINPTMENVYWWHGCSRTKDKNIARLALLADMSKWTPIALLPPPRIEPVVLEKEPVIPEVEKPATEPVSHEVNITVQASEPKIEKPVVAAPIAAPSIPVTQPIPAPLPEPVIPATPVTAVKPALTKPAAAATPEPKPAVTATPEPKPAAAATPELKPAATAAPELKPAPVIEPAPAPVAEPAPAPLIETSTAVTKEAAPADLPAIEPAAAVEADPFAADEVPAAEIVVPQKQKKPWWKF